MRSFGDSQAPISSLEKIHTQPVLQSIIGSPEAEIESTLKEYLDASAN